MAQFNPRSPEHVQPLRHVVAIESWNVSHYAAPMLQRSLQALYPNRSLAKPLQPAVSAVPAELQQPAQTVQPAVEADFAAKRAHAIAESEVGIKNMLTETEDTEPWSEALDTAAEPVVTQESMIQAALSEIAAIHDERSQA